MNNRRLLFAALVCFAVAAMLFAALAYGAQSLHPQTSPDGLWRVEIADYTSASRFELWSTPSVGGVRRKIGHAVPSDYDVFEFVISGDSKTVVYRQGRTAIGESKLYATRIDAASGGTTGVQISQPIAGSHVGAFIEPWRGGRQVRYRWSEVQGPLGDLYVVSVYGGPIRPSKIFNDGFEMGNIGEWR